MKVIEGKEKEYEQYVKNNSKDAYSKAVVTWGENFAKLLDGGRSDFDVMTHESDTEGGTGFMYGCMIEAIAHFHPRGEEVRQWHNTQWGGKRAGEVNKSGGVINPAIIEINTPTS